MSTHTRFSMLKLVLIASLASTFVVAAPAVHAQTITAFMHSSVRVLDPIITTAQITRNHGYMIYDTLLATNAKNEIQPQMVEKWDVSADGKSYTFTLRPGLKWHDGAPVKAEDCVASIKRWAEQNKMGQMMNRQLAEMRVIDDNSFIMSFKEPTDFALRALAKPSGITPFMMPKRIAETPSNQAIKEFIGSDQFPASGTAGGKVVKVDRVKWVAMPDSMTSVNALLSGEMTIWSKCPTTYFLWSKAIPTSCWTCSIPRDARPSCT